MLFPWSSVSVLEVHVTPVATPKLQPIVMVHGAFHGSWYLRPLQELLAREFGLESFALDLNTEDAVKAHYYYMATPMTSPMGRSIVRGGYEDNFLDPAHMLDVRAALQDLDLDRPTLFGHSKGGRGERDSACSYILGKQVKKTCRFWL